MFGTKHTIRWHNLRFYLNPVTLRLEPIAFDANLQDPVPQVESVINYEPFVQLILADPQVFEAYNQALNQLAQLLETGELQSSLHDVENQHLPVLQTEFRLLSNFNLDHLQSRVKNVAGPIR